MSIQHLNGKEIHFESLGTLGVLRLLLGLAVAEEEKAVRLCGAEVKGDGACLLSVPLVENNKRLWRLERDGVQSGHILTFKGNSSVDFHLWVIQLGQPGQLKSHIVVFVHNLIGGVDNQSYNAVVFPTVKVQVKILTCTCTGVLSYSVCRM